MEELKLNYINKVGNQSFHYWWNAHVLDVLVDAHLRKGDQGEKMLNILHGIKRQNKGLYPNDYYDDMEWQKERYLNIGRKWRRWTIQRNIGPIPCLYGQEHTIARGS